MWRRKIAQRAQARLRFFVARAADRRRRSYSPVEVAEKLFLVKNLFNFTLKINKKRPKWRGFYLVFYPNLLFLQPR
jgi:hypothetical protein